MPSKKKLYILQLLMVIPALVALGFSIAYLLDTTNNVYFGIALLLIGIFFLLKLLLSIYESKLLKKDTLKFSSILGSIFFIIMGIIILVIH